MAAAEVAIYMGYIGRLSEAKEKEKKKVEKRVVGESWIIEGGKGGKEKVKMRKEEESVVTMSVEDVLAEGLRLRAKTAKP